SRLFTVRYTPPALNSCAAQPHDELAPSHPSLQRESYGSTTAAQAAVSWNASSPTNLEPSSQGLCADHLRSSLERALFRHSDSGRAVQQLRRSVMGLRDQKISFHLAYLQTVRNTPPPV